MKRIARTGSVVIFALTLVAGFLGHSEHAVVAESAPQAAAATSSGIVTIDPVRVLDSRLSAEPGSRWGTGSSWYVPVSGQGAVPQAGVVAVVVNVTITDSIGSGWASVHPVDGAPGASTVNFESGVIASNMAIVPLGDTYQDLGLTTGGSGAMHVIVDLVGYEMRSDSPSVVALSPIRWLDTRTGTPLTTQSVRMDLRGVPGGRPAGATAAIVNITATGAVSGGYIRAYAADTPPPGISTVNYREGHTTANMAIVPLNAQGDYWVEKIGAQTDFIIDIIGYVTAQSATTDGGLAFSSPKRVVDSRVGAGGVSGSRPTQSTLTVNPVTLAGFNPAQMSAIMANVTLTNTIGGGYICAFAGGAPQPPTSNSNWGGPVTKATFAMIPVATDGTISIYFGGPIGSRTDVIIDVIGYVYKT